MKRKIEKTIVGLLFSDVAGYSKLNEPQLRDFIEYVLPDVAGLLKKYRGDLLELNTWGDAVFAISPDPYRLARLALDLRHFYTKRGSSFHHLPDNLSCRIALHAGVVFTGYDPIRERKGVIGTQVNLAARIEPVTFPGEVWVTEQFRNLIDPKTDPKLAFDDLGERTLAKKFGSAHLYRLHWSDETPLQPNISGEGVEDILLNGKYIDSNEMAIIRDTNARCDVLTHWVAKPQKELRTTRFSKRPIGDPGKSKLFVTKLYETIQKLDNKKGLVKRIVCLNHESKAQHVRDLCNKFAKNQGLVLYITQDQHPFELFIVDDHVAFVGLTFPGIEEEHIDDWWLQIQKKETIAALTYYYDYVLCKRSTCVKDFRKSPISDEDLERLLKSAGFEIPSQVIEDHIF